VTDNEPPAISCPTNIVANVDASLCSSVVTYSAPVGTDSCAGAVTTQTGGLASGSAFPVGVTTNVFLVTDAAGNTATCSFTVTVTDSQPPVISCPTNIVANVGASLCSAVVTYTRSEERRGGEGALTTQTGGLASGTAFPVGVTTNVFLVNDAAGTTATAPVGTDSCAGALTTQTAGLASGSAFPVGVTTNVLLVADAAGNTATCSFTVTVTDSEPPVISCPTNIVANVDASLCSAVVTYTAPVGTDSCAGAARRSSDRLASGSAFPVGVTTNVFLVTDAAGNTATCSFTVTVTDS